MKTIVCITVTDRTDYLHRTVAALVDSGWNGLIVLADDSEKKLQTPSGVTAHLWNPAIGCSKQINRVIQGYRNPGDWLIWMADDIEVITPLWIDLCHRFAQAHPEVGLLTGKLTNFTFHGGIEHNDEWGRWWETPYINTPLVMTDRYLDQVGFVDELGPGHKWGFQDVLASHRCRAMGLKIAQLEAIYGHHPHHPEGNHPKLAAQWHHAFSERMDAISAGRFRLNSQGYPI